MLLAYLFFTHVLSNTPPPSSPWATCSTITPRKYSYPSSLRALCSYHGIDLSIVTLCPVPSYYIVAMLRISPLLFLCAMLVDLVLAITLVSLFASAYPDGFRTALWQNGGSEGWNSDPQQRVYNYANYRESPPIPLSWDQR